MDYAVRRLVSSVTKAVFLPSSAIAIRPAVASDARLAPSPDVRFWHKADMMIGLNDVRFRGKADMGAERFNVCF
jgi:hypothetical protein